jgi:hypothetical protein
MKKKAITRFLLLIFTLFIINDNLNAQYCATINNCSTGAFINSFSTSGGVLNITNNNSSCSQNGYHYFSAQAVTINAFGSFNFSISGNSSVSQGYAIWVDWNSNGSFNDAGEMVWISAQVDSLPKSGIIVAPSTAIVNTVIRMRVMSRLNNIPLSPCDTNLLEGEAEDYSIFIQNTACTAPPSSGTAFASDSVVCSGQAFQLGLSGYSTGTGLSFQWQVSTTGAAGAFSNIAGATSPSVSRIQTVQSWYRCIVTCSAQQSISSVVSVSIGLNYMSGNYTVNPNLPITASNFNTLNQAVNALVCNGINGPITITVAPGIYAEQVNIPTIFGASDTTRITIDGVDANYVTITANPTASATRHVLRLIDSPYITIKNLTLVSTNATYGFALHMVGNAEGVEILNNKIQISTTSTGTGFCGICFSGTTTSATSATSNLQNIKVQNNQIVGGYYGITLNSLATSVGFSNIISGNTLLEIFNQGIYAPFQTDFQVTNNQISFRQNTSSVGIQITQNLASMGNNTLVNSNQIYGVYTNGISISFQNAIQINQNIIEFQPGNPTGRGLNLSSIDNNFSIQRNKITSPGQYGIFIATGNASDTLRPKIVNNMIGGGFSNATSYGIYFTSVKRVDIWYNSIWVDNGAGAALFITSNTTSLGHDIRNNSFSHTGTAAAYAVYLAGTAIANVFDYNNYYCTGTNLAYYGTNKTDLFQLQNTLTGFFHNQNSYQGNPNYLSPTNLAYTGTQLLQRGVHISGYSIDINGTTRPTTNPDIGAFQQVACSGVPFAGTISTSNTDPCLNDLVTLSFDNAPIGIGLTLSWEFSFDNISWTPISGAVLPSYSYNASSAIYFRGRATCNSQSSVTNVIQMPFNYPALSGNYTLNASLPSSSSNFTTLNDFATRISCAGVNGPVNLTIAPGTYNEQVIFASIPGVTPQTPITIDGVNNALCTLAFTPSVSASRHIIRLDNVSYFTIKNLSIINNSTTTGFNIHMLNGCDSITITDNIIISNQTSISANFAAIVASSSLTAATGAGNNANRVIITNNTIIGAYFGIALIGIAATQLQGNVIQNNNIRNTYYYPIYLANNDAPKVLSNQIRLRQTNASSMGVYLNGVNNDFNISRNVILFPGAFGIYSSAGNVANSVRARISNNMIGGGFQNTATPYGIYFTNTKSVDIWYNSVNVDNGNGMALYMTSNTTSTGHDIRNNSFAYTGSGSGYAMYLVGLNNAIALNYNNYFSGGSNFVYYASARANLTALQGANATIQNDVNSHQGNPFYTADTNLIFLGNQLSMKGVSIPQITTDIYGTPRPTNTNTDIGAFQYLQCTNAFAGNIIASSTNPCFTESVLLSIDSTSQGAGKQFQWQSSLSGASGTWTNLVGDTGLTISLQLQTTTWYRCVVICYSQSDTSNAVQIHANFNPLSGNYTINPSMPSSVSNFQSFTELSNRLQCDAITGPVTITVSPGLYTEQVEFLSVLGSSDSNTITLDGINPQQCTLRFAPTIATQNAVLKLNGISHFTLKNFTIENFSTTLGWNIHFSALADSIKLIDNVILSNITSTSTNFAGIVVSPNTTPTATGVNIHGLQIIGNKIYGGYYGISVNGQTNLYTQDVTISGNEIENAYYYGLYLSYLDATQITSNKIVNRLASTASYGMYLIAVNNSFSISKNTIYRFGTFGIYITTGNATNTARANIINNMIGGQVQATAAAYGIYFTNAKGVNIWYNSILMDNNGASTSFYATSNTTSIGLDIRNNSFAYTGTNAGGTAMYIVGLNSPIALNYNNYHSTGTNLVYYGVVRVDLTALQGANATIQNDVNSKSGNPVYFSNSDLRHFGTQLAQSGDTIPAVTDDIFGNARPTSTSPDIGAFQSTSCTGAYIGNLVLTENTICPTTNFSLSIDSVILASGTTVQWQLSTDSINWTNIPNSNIGMISVSQTQTTYYRAHVSCGAFADTSSVLLVKSSFFGIYSINPSIPKSPQNFHTFNELTTALTCMGISGPTTVNVSPGLFTEQVLFTAYAGSSPINTLTIDGGNADTVLLTFNQTASANRYTMRFNGAKNMTIQNMTIDGGNSTYSLAVHLLGAADSINILNNIIKSTEGSTSANFAAIVASNSTTSITTAGNCANNILIANNKIIGGSHSIRFNGAAVTSLQNIRILNNEILNGNSYGIFLTYCQSPQVIGNTITQDVAGSLNSFGVYFTFVNDSFKLNANVINSFKQYGVYMANCTATLNTRSQIINNAIGGGFTNITAYGMYLTAVSNSKIYNNSILVDGPTNNVAMWMNITSTTNIELLNNIFKSTGTSATSYSFDYNNNSQFLVRNYNNYYTNGLNIARMATTNYTSLATLQAGSFDANSHNVNPFFTSSLNLIPASHILNNAGLSLADVTTDILGNTRTATPDIGAYEFVGPTCILASNLSATGITDTSANLSWVPFSAGFSHFQVEYGPSGFSLGTGILLNNITNTFTQIAGLTVVTTYDFYVRTFCSANDSSIWAGPHIFTTSCGVFNAPFLETFSTGLQPLCWQNTSSGTGTASIWRFGTGIAGGATANGKALSTYAWVDGSNPILSDVTLTTPFIKVDGLTKPALSFEFFSNNINNSANMTMYVSFWNGSVWYDTIFISNANFPNWQVRTFDLSVYPITGPIRFKFVVDKVSPFGSTASHDILLDDVKVYDICPILPLKPSISGDTISCRNATANFTALIQQGETAKWYSDASLTNLIDSSASIAYGFANAGNNTLYAVSSIGECLSQKDSIQIIVIGEPTIDSVNSINPTSCVGTNGSIQIFASGGSGNLYYNLGGANQLANSFSNLAQGTYQAFVYDSTCNFSIAGNIIPLNWPGALAAPVVSADTIYCPGATISALQASGPGVNFYWYANGSLTNLLDSGSTYQPTPTLPGVYNYYVIQRDVNGCASAASTVKITIKQTPATPNASGTSVCLGVSNASISVSGIFGNYRWYSNASLSNQIGTNATLSVAIGGVGSTVYFATQTDSFGCQSLADTAIVTVNPLPNQPSVSVGGDYCVGQSIQALTASGVAGATYIWYNDANLTNQLATGNSYSPGVLAPGFYTYYVVSQNQFGCKSSSALALINVYSNPAAPTVIGAATYCSSDTLNNLVASGVTGTYNWYSNAALTTLIGIGNVIIPASTIGTTNYYVNVTDANNCKSAAAIAAVTVNSSPNVIFTSPPPICNDTNPLALTFGLPTGGSYSGNFVSGAMFSTSNAGIGSHQVSYTFTNANNCSATANGFIHISPGPSVSISKPNDVCDGDSIVSLQVGSPAGGVYSGISVNAANATFNPIIGVGTYSIIYTFTDTAGCAASDSSQITVHPKPQVSHLPINDACDNGNLISLSGGNPIGGNYSGTFISNNQFNTASSGSGLFGFIYSYTDANSCSNFDSVSIRVNALPNVSLGTLDSVCDNHSISTLSGGMPLGGVYSGIGVQNNNFDPKVNGAGSVIITYTYTDNNNCTNSATNSKMVVQSPNPQLYLGSTDTNICMTQIVELNAGPGAAYSWSSGETSQTIILNQFIHSIIQYNVTVTNNFGCQGHGFIRVTRAECVGIEEIKTASSVLIYPNPSAGQFTLEFENFTENSLQIEILNVQGQVIFTKNIAKPSETKSLEIDLSMQARGFYLLRLSNSETMQVHKLQLH